MSKKNCELFIHLLFNDTTQGHVILEVVLYTAVMDRTEVSECQQRDKWDPTVQTML